MGASGEPTILPWGLGVEASSEEFGLDVWLLDVMTMNSRRVVERDEDAADG